MSGEHQSRQQIVKELGSKPEWAKAKKQGVNNRQWKPPATHPWKAALLEREEKRQKR